MSDKIKYRDLCKTEHTIPIFSKDWWLDAVCGEKNWDVILIKKGGNIVASLPYRMSKMHGYNVITMPSLTQAMGPWIKYPENQKLASKLSYEEKLLTSLINKLPKTALFRQNFHHTVTNWLPFYWKAFSQTTRYTYILDDLSDTKKLWKNLQSNIRKEINKASKRFNLKIKYDLDIDRFLELNEMVFERQKLKPPYSRDFVKRLHSACVEHNAQKIIYTEDQNRRVYAAVYIVWDKMSAYYLMGGSNPIMRVSGANSMCMWNAIIFASQITKLFDFEGSMIQPIERFFRSFGAKQKPYSQITKFNSRLLQLLWLSRSIIKI